MEERDPQPDDGDEHLRDELVPPPDDLVAAEELGPEADAKRAWWVRHPLRRRRS